MCDQVILAVPGNKPHGGQVGLRVPDGRAAGLAEGLRDAAVAREPAFLDLRHPLQIEMIARNAS